MEAIGSPTNTIRNFIKDLESGEHGKIALEKPKPPETATRFVSRNLEMIEKGNAIGIASFFAFGRELLLPRIFSQALMIQTKTTLAGSR